MQGPGHEHTGWNGYWDELKPHPIFAVEASEYVRKLMVDHPFPATAHVLDFGCGFGYATEFIASSVTRVEAWDAAAGMRAATTRRLGTHSNAAVVDLSTKEPEKLRQRYDTILVNSVVQYLSQVELTEWLDFWRIVLRPGGKVIVSDLPMPGGSATGELLGLLRFAARHRMLGRMVLDGLAEARRYHQRRAAANLLRLNPSDFGRLAAQSGFAMTRLSRNLTHRQGRYSVVLRPAIGC